MSQKIIKTRISLKYDTWGNWFKNGIWENGVFTPNENAQTTYADGFIPLAGEIVFVEIPQNTGSGATTHEPAILFKVGDGNTNLTNLPWGSALAADVYSWAKQRSLLGGTQDQSGNWSFNNATAAQQATQAEVAAFIDQETSQIRMKVDKVTLENFRSIYGRDYNPATDADKIGKYQISISVDDGNTWKASGDPFDVQIEPYTAGQGIDITNNSVSVKVKNQGMIEHTDDGHGTDTGIDVKKSTVTYSEATGVTDANISGTTGVLTDQAISPLKAYIDAKASGSSASSTVTVEQITAETGYAATYIVKQNGSQVGVSINIPKDFVVKSAELETVVEDNVPYIGARVGDKYIDFIINTTDSSVNGEHIYLPVKDLVDVYTANNQTDPYVTLHIDEHNNITATTAVSSMENAHDTIWEFRSYGAASGGPQYGVGSVERVSSGNGKTTVKVLTNSAGSEWVGRQFTVNSETVTEGQRYQLYENNEPIPVWVEITNTLGATVGVADALDTKRYIENTVKNSVPNIEAGPGISVSDTQNSKTVSVKLDETNSTIPNNNGSGLISSNDGVRIDDSITWIFRCGNATDN